MSTASEIQLAALKTALDGGRMYWFAGPVPNGAEAALDMSNDHTLLVEMTNGGDGITGLTFEAPSGNALERSTSEDWTGLVEFDGAQAASPTLTPTFWRFCADGDNGQAAATGPRLQGRIGGPSDSIPFTGTLTDNGANTQGLSYFAVLNEQV